MSSKISLSKLKRENVCVSVCHKKKSANALVSGSGSDILLIQDIEPSNSRAGLSHATLRFFSLAEQCHTQNFYLRCFKSDFDAVKSKFCLVIE